MNSNTVSLPELDSSVRLGLFLLCHVFLFVWVRFVVASAKVGAARILRCLPIVPVLLFATFLFDVDNPAEFIPAVYCTHNFLWLTASKLWSFCLNRGQLVRSYEAGSKTAFALGLLFPVTVAFDVKPVEKEKEQNHNHKQPHAYKDVQFTLPTFSARQVLYETLQTAMHMAAKVILIASMNWGYGKFAESGYSFWRDVCSCWIFYAATAFVEDLASLTLMLTMNIKTATSFDSPWMAQSVTELWSKRYNLVFGLTLRDLVYDPICEGSLIHGPNYFNKQRPSALRRMVGVLMTFGASGLIHILAMQHSLKTDPMVHYGLFFVINGIVVVLENTMKMLLKSTGYASVVSSMVPNWVYHVYSIVLVFTLAHLFFWPDLNAIGGAEMIANGVMTFLHNLKVLP